MAKYQFFYRLDNLQIDAVYRDCRTESSVFKNPATYMEVNVTDPPYEVTRDHKVVLDIEGNVIGTEPSINSMQPVIVPQLRMSLHEARIISFDTEAVKPVKTKLIQDGNEFDVDCYVTQDLVDAYQAGDLKVGDWVLVYFIDQREDKAIAQQKIFKTW